jgi:hypothetical protein
MRRISPNQLLAGILAGAALVLLASQWRAIHTENVNWDEFVLLARAEMTTRTGRIYSGDRPGLATLILVPFVENCRDAVQAIVSARKLWLVFTAAYLAGVFALVTGTIGERRNWHGAALAVALVALVPVFLRWSLQVRADQPALLFACWGGVLLLASSRRRMLAIAAGALFGLGYLASQKAVYIAALSVLLLLTRLAREHASRTHAARRAVESLVITAIGGVAVLASYGLLLSLFYVPPAQGTLGRTFDTFAFYRAVFGYGAYVAMLPTLVPHLILVGATAGALLLAVRRSTASAGLLAAAVLVMLLGVGVGAFHAAAFPYFWMTLGVFPAVAAGIAFGPILEAFDRRIGRTFVAVATALLLVSAARAILARTDTQEPQRDALAFIDRTFAPAIRGFQAEGALACRHDPNPFPIYFAETAGRLFGGVGGRLRAQAFIDEFRRRPVTFVVMHRLYAFPPAIEQFWRTRYVLYRDEVMIPGRYVSGPVNASVDFEVIVPGTYRWQVAGATPARLVLGGSTIEPGSTVALDRGVHRLMLPDGAVGGRLVLAVDEEPQPEGAPFYDPRVVYEIAPGFVSD